ALHLRAETKFGELLGAGDAGLAAMQARRDFLRVRADRGHDAHPRDHDASHFTLSVIRGLRRIQPSGWVRRAEQAYAHIRHVIYALAVRLQPPIGNAEDQFAPEDAFHVDAVNDLLDCWEHLVRKFHFSDA